MATIDTATQSEAASRAAKRAPAPSLRGPEPDDAWRVAPLAHAPAPAPEARLGSGEHLLVEPEDPNGRSTLFYGMVAAVCIVAAVLGGMAALSYGNGPGITQSAAFPAR